MSTTPEQDPQSWDPLAVLTMDELGDGSRQLKGSIVAAVTGQSADYERALAATLWLHRRRADPSARFGDVLGLTFVQVQSELTALAPAGPADPTTPTP